MRVRNNLPAMILATMSAGSLWAAPTPPPARSESTLVHESSPALLTGEGMGLMDPAQTHVLRSRHAMIDRRVVEMIESGVTGRLAFNFFDDAAIIGEVTSTETRTADSQTICGALEGETGGWFIMAIEDDAVVMNLWSTTRGYFQIRPELGQETHIVEQLDACKLGGCDAGSLAAPPRLRFPGQGGGTGVDDTLCAQAIDVMVVYTPRARDAVGGDLAIRALAYASVASSNIVNENSGVTARLRLVHVALVNYTEAPELGTDLGRLQGVDGFMDEVLTMRSLYGADLVSLLVQSDSNSCGVAYVMTFPSHSFGNLAFSVVQQNCSLGNLSFAHELAHNLGCNHDWADPSQGAFGYSHGLRFVGTSGQTWRTVMAASSGTRIPYLSNPAVVFDGVGIGIPEGQANPADNARTVNNTASIASGFLFNLNFVDCNGNGVRDACDIIDGVSLDVNENGVPDECEAVCQAHELTKLVTMDAASFDRFGGSVAMCDDRIVVGSIFDDDAGNDSGSAYVFHRSGRNTWVQEAKLTAADAAPFQNFGRSVAVSPGGEFIIVGAYRDVRSFADVGALYIFKRDGATWVQDVKIVNPDPQQSDWFGWSVAWAGSESGELFAVVGAPLDNEAANDAGAVYICRKTNAGWDTPLKLVATNASANDAMGYSVAGDLAGDRIVAGAPSANTGATGSGAAIVFRRVGENWIQENTLAANDPRESARLGWSVAVGGTTVLAGAVRDSEDGYRAGAAYVFQAEAGIPGTFVQKAKLKPIAGPAERQFGAAVALRGDRAVIGSILDAAGAVASGSAFIFTRTSGWWKQSARISPADGAAFDNFGVSVAIAPSVDLAVAGAYFDDHHGTVDGGSASVFSMTLPDSECCPADIHGPDGVVNVSDLLAVIFQWGPCPGRCPAEPCPADITGDCVVNEDDLLAVIADWGPCR